MSGINHVEFGASTGPSLLLDEPMITDGDVWYVSSVDGTDDSTRGKDRAAPLATLSQAVTNAAAGDWIVLLSNHDETLTGLSISKKLTIVGEGKSAGLPQPKLTHTKTSGTGASTMVTISDSVRVSNVYWPNAGSGDKTNSRFSISGNDVRFEECYFEQGDHAGKCAFSGTPLRFTLKDCTVKATHESTEGEPFIDTTVALDQLRMINTVFDGGTAGFGSSSSVPYAVHINAASDDVEIEGCSLKNGADFFLHASSARGHVSFPTKTGGARFVW